jgi:hypothetical protein
MMKWRGSPWLAEAIARILEPPSPKNPHAAALRGTVLNAAKIVLDHTLDDEDEPPANTLIDVSKLSTPLLRMLQAELRQIAMRESQNKAAVSQPTPGAAAGSPP